jgi:hypothetical protein
MTFPLPFHLINSSDISRISNPLFRPSLENAIALKNHQCHHATRLIKRNPTPTSRKD